MGATPRAARARRWRPRPPRASRRSPHNRHSGCARRSAFQAAQRKSCARAEPPCQDGRRGSNRDNREGYDAGRATRPRRRAKRRPRFWPFRGGSSAATPRASSDVGRENAGASKPIVTAQMAPRTKNALTRTRIAAPCDIYVSYRIFLLLTMCALLELAHKFAKMRTVPAVELKRTEHELRTNSRCAVAACSNCSFASLWRCKSSRPLRTRRRGSARRYSAAGSPPQLTHRRAMRPRQRRPIMAQPTAGTVRLWPAPLPCRSPSGPPPSRLVRRLLSKSASRSRGRTFRSMS